MQSFEVGPFGVNTFLLWDEETKQAAIVDPTMGSEPILDVIAKQGLALEYVINTHGHVDHAFCDQYYKDKTQAKLLIHAADVPLLQNLGQMALRFGMSPIPAPMPDRLLADGDTIAIGAGELSVLHTPGHSPGGICLLGDFGVIVGDTLFNGSIGRTDLPGASGQQLLRSVREKLFVLPDDTKAYPGHGPETTIGAEKRFNPFFQGHSGLWLP